jgi:hypothetical protein
VDKFSGIRYVNQPDQGYYGAPDNVGGLRLKNLISVYRQRLSKFVRPRTLSSDEHQNFWFWKRVWAQFPKSWTYPKGIAKAYPDNSTEWGNTIGENTIAQAFPNVDLAKYDFVYFMRKPGKIISKTWLAHILAEEGWKLDE